MKFSTRELTTLAMFGALWGVVEVSLGAVLKSFNLPLNGALLAALGIMIALTARVFVPRRGATLFIGVIAMLLKLFSLGGVVLGPMVGILMEAIIAEVGLSAAGRLSRWTFVGVGGLVVLYTLVQPFITGPLLFGRALLVVWLDLLDLVTRLLGISTSAALGGIAVLALIHLAIGGLAGWLSWEIARQLQTRLGRSQTWVENS
jgi:hypothetical protein